MFRVLSLVALFQGGLGANVEDGLSFLQTLANVQSDDDSAATVGCAHWCTAHNGAATSVRKMCHWDSCAACSECQGTTESVQGTEDSDAVGQETKDGAKGDAAFARATHAGGKDSGKGEDLHDESSGLALKDVAIGVRSGRPEYWDAIHNSVLTHLPRGMIVQFPGLCSCAYRAALRELMHAHPDAEWYYVVDEDVFIYLERLATLLSKEDASVPTLIAQKGSGRFEDVCGKDSSVQRPDGGGIVHTTFYGGTGFILSRALAKLINVNAKCDPDGPDMDDRAFSCDIGSVWKPSYKFVNLASDTGTPCERHGECGDLTKKGEEELSEFKEMNWPDPIVTVHHLAPDEITKMAGRNKVFAGEQHKMRHVSTEKDVGLCRCGHRTQFGFSLVPCDKVKDSEKDS